MINLAPPACGIKQPVLLLITLRPRAENWHVDDVEYLRLAPVLEPPFIYRYFLVLSVADRPNPPAGTPVVEEFLAPRRSGRPFFANWRDIQCVWRRRMGLWPCSTKVYRANASFALPPSWSSQYWHSTKTVFILRWSYVRLWR